MKKKLLPILFKKSPLAIIDEGRKEIDLLLDGLLADVIETYSEAAQTMQEKAENYLKWFATEDKKKRAEYISGLISKKDYQDWRARKILEGKRWYAMADVLANDLASCTEKVYSIINGYMPEAYAISGNWAAYEIEHNLKVETNFTLYNAETIENLLRDKPDLLPRASLDKNEAIRRNKQKLNSAVMQSILLGESNAKLAGRVGGIAGTDSKASIRIARTMMTSAENNGIYDQHVRAKEMGITAKHAWMATLDGRTRHSHRLLDGEIVEVGERFSNGMLKPGDPDGPPEEVYNCRCRLRSVFPGQDLSKLERNSKLGDMSYEDWKQGKKVKEEAKK